MFGRYCIAAGSVWCPRWHLPHERAVLPTEAAVALAPGHSARHCVAPHVPASVVPAPHTFSTNSYQAHPVGVDLRVPHVSRRRVSHPGNSLRTHESREAGLWGEVDFEIEIMVNVIFRKGMINSVTVSCLQLADMVC